MSDPVIPKSGRNKVDVFNTPDRLAKRKELLDKYRDKQTGQQLPVPPWELLYKNEFEEKKKRALKDPWEFLDLIHFIGGKTQFSPFHRALLNAITHKEYPRRLVLAPRGHLKSTVGSVLFTLWRIYCNPDVRILVGCATKELATGFVRQVKQFLEDPTLQEWVWNSRPHIEGPLIPVLDRLDSKRSRQTIRLTEAENSEEYTEAADKKVMWRSNAVQVVRPSKFKEPTVYACSVGMSVTGWHFDICIFDDIVTYDNSDTPHKARKILSWTHDIESVLNPYNKKTRLGGEMIVLGTPYYEWDYYSHLLGIAYKDNPDEYSDYLESLEFDPIYVMWRDIYGVGVTGVWNPEKYREDTKYTPKEEKYMCPNLFNEHLERKLRSRLGVRRFSSQYLVKHFDSTQAVLNIYDIQTIPTQAITWDTTNRFIKINVPPIVLDSEEIHWSTRQSEAEVVEVPLFLCVDPAVSLSETADYTAIAVGGKDKYGRLFVVDLVYGRFSVSQMADKIQELVTRWRLGFITLETSGQQLAIKSAIADKWRQIGFICPIREDRPTGNKKERLVATLEPLLTGRRLYLTSHLLASQELRNEFLGFPTEGVRDDILDAIEKLYRVSLSPVGSDTSYNRRYRQRVTINSKYGGYR